MWRLGSIKCFCCFLSLLFGLVSVRVSVKGGISVFTDFLEEALRVPSYYLLCLGPVTTQQRVVLF